MDSRGFPFNKLIKIFLIVILTTLPFVLYYYLHTKQQTDYLNQRNFRALNEIILQYQNHFEALSNLFKFPPPSKTTKYEFDEKTKHYFDTVKQQLNKLKENEDFNNYVGTEWIDLQLEEIDSIKKYNKITKGGGGEEEKEERIKLEKELEEKLEKELEEKINQNISDKREEIERLLKSLFGPRNDLNVINKREQLSDIIKQLQKIEILLEKPNLKLEILYNEALIRIYQSRLRLNESLGNIKVAQDNEYQEDKGLPCFDNIKLVLDDSREPASVTAKACSYIYETTLSSLVGNIRHNEFDAVLLVNQTGKVLFSKELTALHWRDAIDSHDQTNYTGLSVSNIEHILKRAVNDSVSKTKTEGDSAEVDNTDKTPLIGLSTTQTENIGGKEYIFFFQPFKLSYALNKNTPVIKINPDSENIPPTFYMIGLVQQARFRKEALSIPTTFSAFIFVVLFFGILTWSSVKLNFIGVREHISRGDISFLLISLFITSGVAAIFFVSLLTMEIMEKRLDNKSVKIGMEISRNFDSYLDDIIKEFQIYKNTVFKHYQGDYHTNLKNYIHGIRIKSVSDDNELQKSIEEFESEFAAKKNDYAVLIVYTANAPDKWMVAGFNDKGEFKKVLIDSPSGELSENLMEKPVNENRIVELVTSKLKLNLKRLEKNPEIFPKQRDIFAVNEDGLLFQDMHFFVEDFNTAIKLRIPTRDYFKKVLKGNAWHAESDRIYLQRIRNYSDGVKSTQIAMPITDGEFGIALPDSSYNDKYKKVTIPETKPPRVLASTTYFQSLVAPVLPNGFQYAIIDDSTGIVLYHSQDDKAFAENFYSEAGYNNELIAAIKSAKEHRKGSQGSNKGIQYPITGKYHAKQTNFHVVPLKTVPWSLITFYPKELAHSIAIESGITAFVGFLLYTAIYYFIILFCRICNQGLKKHDELICVWLWPERNKKHQYVFFSLLMLPFCLIYIFGVYYLDIRNLISYLMVSMLAQLLLVYFSLNKKWFASDTSSITAVESRLKIIPVMTAFFVELIILVFIIKMNNLSFHNTTNILLMLALAILLYNLLLLNHPFSNNQHSILQFKTFYTLMVTMTLLLLSATPSVALYKDSLTFYSQMLSRQGQLEVAHNVQQRYSRLDTFAKLFFPNFHTMSNGHTKCSTFNFAEDNTGIYGFNKTELTLNINKDNDKKHYINSYGCSTVPTESTEPFIVNSIMASSFSGYLFQLLAGFHLYLSQQYTAAQENFIEKGWRFDANNTLSFTTMGINGKLEHKVSASPLNLSSVLETLIYTNNDSLSFPAKMAFLLLGLLYIFWFYRRVLFIVRQVFAIDIPEIVKNNKLKNLISNEMKVSGQFQVLINGVDENIKEFCEEITTIENIADFNLSPIDNSELGRLVSYIRIEVDNETNENNVFTFYVVPDFIIATNNQNTRHLILDYLEKIQKEARSDKGIFILLCAEIHPLRCLIKPELYSGTHMQHFSDISSHEDKYRWIKFLTNFLEHNNYEELNPADIHTETSDNQINELKEYINKSIFWPDPDKIREKALNFVEKNKETHEITREEIIEFLGNHNYPYYRRLWSLCNRDERLMLYQLATGRFANPNNRGVIRSLYSRGYIVRAPYFRIPDECFKKFILAAESVTTFQKWEKEAAHSLWANIKAPLFVTLVFLAGLFIYISTDAVETTIGLLTPLLALIPLLLRGISTVQATEALEKTLPPDDLEAGS